MTENTQLAAALDTLRELTAYSLAGSADCGSPDSLDSSGAQFLKSVRDSFIESVEYEFGEDDDDVSAVLERLSNDGSLSQIADGAPDVYTHPMWSEFVDLQAYQEDPTELGSDGFDMEQAARIRLYIIAERLVSALSDLLAEAFAGDESE